MANIVIERNVPLPTSQRMSKLPFDQLNIGESFLVQLEQGRGANVHSACSAANKRNPEKHFVCRKMGDSSFRVWRDK